MMHLHLIILTAAVTLPADDTGYWIDENGKVLYSPAKITKDTTITFKQFVSVLGDVNQTVRLKRQMLRLFLGMYRVFL